MAASGVNEDKLWETPQSRATCDWLRPSMSTAVMTRRAFDTRENLADQLFRCLGTTYSDVMEHNTVPATVWCLTTSEIARTF